MITPIIIDGEVSLSSTIIGEVSLLNVINGECGIFYKVESDPAEIYSGEYEVTPLITAQTLSTANKLMLEDVTVKEIPYYETSNVDGGYTVYIANSL